MEKNKKKSNTSKKRKKKQDVLVDSNIMKTIEMFLDASGEIISINGNDVTKKSNKKRGLLVFLVCFLCVLGVCLSFIVGKVAYYKNRTFPRTYLRGVNISKVHYNKLENKINLISDEVVDRKIILKYDNVDLEYSFKDLGIDIDKEETLRKIRNSHNNINYIDRIIKSMGIKKTSYNYNIVYDENKIREFLVQIKEKFDVNLESGRFIVDDYRNVSYKAGVDSHIMNVDESLKEIIKVLNKKISKKVVVNLVVTSEKADSNELYKMVDTKTSSFVTKFDPYISRATNLRSALKNIDGVILEPGDVFSFYKYAGPYNKSGYVFYYEFVGNGVCQIATTVYNTALLGGLEIVKRYQHANMVPYVPGGLDATVASYSDGRYIDFQFKNTYQYPIYISAYSVGGEAHVDFWSNKDAMEGKTYKTESVQIGYLGYSSYLYTYKDGVLLDKKHLANSWYKAS